MEPTTQGSIGPVISTIIILAVIIFGGLYFWIHSHNAANNAANTASTTTSMEEGAPVPTSTSTDPGYDVNSDMNGS